MDTGMDTEPNRWDLIQPLFRLRQFREVFSPCLLLATPTAVRVGDTPN
jgi:hypothetical protein